MNGKKRVIFRTTRVNRLALKGLDGMACKLEEIIDNYYKSGKAREKEKTDHVTVAVKIGNSQDTKMAIKCKQFGITQSEFINQAIEFSKVVDSE